MLTSDGNVFRSVLKMIFRPFNDLISLNMRLTLIARNIVDTDANFSDLNTYLMNMPNSAPMTTTKSNIFQFSLK